MEKCPINFVIIAITIITIIIFIIITTIISTIVIIIIIIVIIIIINAHFHGLIYMVSTFQRKNKDAER